MAKEKVTAITVMTKKAKWLNFLKIFGICLGGMVALVAGVVLYVWATGGFNPPYVPLTNEVHFEKSEYVIDGNKDKFGKQIVDEKGNPIYQTIKIVPNENCTEIDGILTISSSTNDSLVLQLVEDDNTKVYVSDENKNSQKNAGSETATVLYDKYNVKFNTDIKINPLTKKITKTIDGKEVEVLVNIGGWVKLSVTGNSGGDSGLISCSCWVFVDSPITSYDIDVEDKTKVDAKEVTNNDTNETYTQFGIYENSNIKVISNNFFPVNSCDLPSTVKNTTSYTEKKDVVYYIDEKQVATIDNYGNITILPNNNGREFTVKSYVVSKYNSIGHLPSIDDFKDSQSPTTDYNNALSKYVCYSSNILHFYVQEVKVASLTTGNQTVVPNYQVFDEAQISFSNKVATINKNNYFVDINLTQTVDESYKSTLLSKVEMYSAYSVDSAETGTDIVYTNGLNLKLSNKYISIEKANGIWNLKALEYNAKDNYILFKYPEPIGVDEDNKDVFAYAVQKITISKIAVNAISPNQNILELSYNQASATQNVTSLANFTQITPSNSTYNKIMYFVGESNDVVEVDNNISVTIDSQKYFAIAHHNDVDDTYDYYSLIPTGSGSVNMIAVVMKTDITGELVQDENNEYQVEAKSNNIVVNISDILNIDLVSVENEQQKIDDKIISDVAHSDNDTTKDITALTILQNGEIQIGLTYTGVVRDFANSGIKILFDGEESSKYIYIKEKKTDDTNKNKYLIAIQGIQSTDSAVLLQLKYMGTTIKTISIKVASNEVDTFKLSLNDQNQSTQIPVEFLSETGEVATSIAYSYRWKLPTISLQQLHGNNLVTDSSLIKKYYLQTYALPSQFETLTDAEIIGQLANVDVLNLVADNSVITITEDSLTGEIIWQVNSAKKTIVRAVQANGIGVKSNAILVSVEKPVVSTTGTNNLTVISFGENVSIDGEHITSANRVKLSSLKFMCNGVNITSLVKYNFSNQIVSIENEKEYYVSKDSSVKIDNNADVAVITMVNLNATQVVEKLTAKIDFIYERRDVFTLTLDADINDSASINNLQSEYSVPTTLDLFSDKNSVSKPALLFVNKNYDKTKTTGNKLYLPMDDIPSGDAETYLTSRFSTEFLNQFLYSDDANAVDHSTDYYHIYNNLSFVAQDGYSYYKDTLYINYSSKQTSLPLKIKYLGEDKNNGITFVFNLNVTPSIYPSFTYNNPYSQNGNKYEVIDVQNTNFDQPLQLLGQNGILTFQKADASNSATATITDISFSKYGFGNVSGDTFFVQKTTSGSVYNIYLKTADISKLDGKTYYKYTEKSQYVAFDVDESYLSYAYEKQYSLSSDKVVIEGKDYYSYDEQTKEYSIVILTVGEEITANYYEASYSLTKDNIVVDKKQYYYKTNYIDAADETNVDNLFELATITIATDNSTLAISQSIKNLPQNQTILLQLVIKFNVANNNFSDPIDYYDYYNVKFE